MSKRQRRIAATTLALLLVLSLFPPWRADFRDAYGSDDRSIGHAFIFAPVHSARTRDLCRIDSGLMLAESLSITAVAGLLTLFWRERPPGAALRQ